jgi:glycosyltransferase involved in cell wall biosynthesis
MKICFFGTRMDLLSGHSRPAFELASALIDRGHEVRIVSTSLPRDRMARHEAALARSPKLGRIPVDRPFASLLEMTRQRRETTATLQYLFADCDLLHGFSFNAMSVMAMFLPVHLPRVLSVSTDIHPPLRDYMRAVATALVYLGDPRIAAGIVTPRFLLERRLRPFGRVISWSSFMHERLRSLGVPEAKIVTIPPGLDRDRFDDAERQVVPGSPVFLYAGLVSTLRGIPTLIRAFKEVSRALPRARLVIADRGPHTPQDTKIQNWEMRRLARMITESGLEGPVLLRHFEENLSAWFNACDAAVLPFSTTIGYAQPPLTMLEAMAHELPVISSRIGSVPEYVEDGVSGILTDPGDEVGLARAMITFDPVAARQMGQNARRRIEALYDWDDIASMTEAVYADVLRSRDTKLATA